MKWAFTQFADTASNISYNLGPAANDAIDVIHWFNGTGPVVVFCVCSFRFVYWEKKNAVLLFKRVTENTLFTVFHF